MKKIAITGGKGGTGKSTIAILLANFLAKKDKKVILTDLDVECPNLYLILGQKLKKPVQKIFAKFPSLDKSKCIKCGKCAQFCRSKAIFQAPNQYPVFFKELCSACGGCQIICPQKAIKSKKEQIGKIYQNQIAKNFWFITGEAKPNLEETGPVVLKTKKYAETFAQKQKAQFFIIDTAAGTHCPVTSALLKADFAYIVTEPTPLGAHDLELILKLSEKLKIPSKIIINQANLGSKKPIYKISQKYKTKVEIEIPYSKKIVKNYSQGNINFTIDKFKKLKL